MSPKLELPRTGWKLRGGNIVWSKEVFFSIGSRFLGNPLCLKNSRKEDTLPLPPVPGALPVMHLPCLTATHTTRPPSDRAHAVLTRQSWSLLSHRRSTGKGHAYPGQAWHLALVSPSAMPPNRPLSISPSDSSPGDQGDSYKHLSRHTSRYTVYI